MPTRRALSRRERWDELIGFIDMVERDRPNQYSDVPGGSGCV